MLAFCFLKSKYSTLFLGSYTGKWASQVAQWVKNLPAVQETQADLMPGLGRSPGGGHGDPLQDACLENPMDRGTWWAPVHRVTKTLWRKQLSMHASNVEKIKWGIIYTAPGTVFGFLTLKLLSKYGALDTMWIHHWWNPTTFHFTHLFPIHSFLSFLWLSPASPNYIWYGPSVLKTLVVS